METSSTTVKHNGKATPSPPPGLCRYLRRDLQADARATKTLRKRRGEGGGGREGGRTGEGDAGNAHEEGLARGGGSRVREGVQADVQVAVHRQVICSTGLQRQQIHTPRRHTLTRQLRISPPIGRWLPAWTFLPHQNCVGTKKFASVIGAVPLPRSWWTTIRDTAKGPASARGKPTVITARPQPPEVREEIRST